MAEISSRLRDALSKWSSSKWFPLSLAIIGFLIPLLEPLYLLAIGKNILALDETDIRHVRVEGKDLKSIYETDMRP